MPNTAIQQLLTAAFGTSAHPLAAWYSELISHSAPLQQFTSTHASKIRKKVRHAIDPDALRDLRCELTVAATLVDRHSLLTYEPLAASNRRGPDFLLHYKRHTNIYVEVSRIRRTNAEERSPVDRLASVLCGKLNQFVAEAANILVLISDDQVYSDETIATTIRGLRQRADAKDDAYFAFRGLANTTSFHQTLPRLSAILIAAPAEAIQTWFLLPQCRFPLPSHFAHTMAQSKLTSINQ